VVAALTVASVGGLTNATPAAADTCPAPREVCYQVTIYTGYEPTAGTDANVYITLVADPDRHQGPASSEEILLNSSSANFERGGADTFIVDGGGILDPVGTVHIRHDNTGTNPSWELDRIRVTNLGLNTEYWFYPQAGCQWLATDHGDGSIERTLRGSGAGSSGAGSCAKPVCRRCNDGLQVVENWNSANGCLFYG